MEKFKIGDRVRLERMEREDDYYNKYLGQSFTIKNINPSIWGNDGTVDFVEYTEDNIRPYIKNLELVRKYNYKDLKKAPIGTKITFQNGYLIKIDKERVYGVINGIYYNGNIDYIILFLKGKVTDERFGKIIKIEEPIYQTVYECKEEILDEAEKRYLSSVIRPFRDKIKYIIKVKSSYDNNFYIRIVLNNDVSTLPYFKKNTMYKGMKLDKKYTLKELNL